MRIVLDAMGSDNHPIPEINAAIEAAKIFGEEIILTGPEEELLTRLESLGGHLLPIRVVNASDVITMGDKGLALALKAKRKGSKTSIAVGIDLVNQGEAQAFVTAGNTGGALASAYYRMKMIRGVERPALTGIFPVLGGHCVVLDIGANPDVKPENLVQFAIMGSVYAEKVLRINQPRVGLLSNGEEAGKGNHLIKSTYPLLKQIDINFIGNIEGKELFGGSVDVAVVDGFTGNILLKSSEAVAKLITDLLRQELSRSPITIFGGILSKPAFSRLKKLMDPSEVGAAPLLGIDGLVFIGHGRSDARALVNAIGVARQAVQTKLIHIVKDTLQNKLPPLPSREAM